MPRDAPDLPASGSPAPLPATAHGGPLARLMEVVALTIVGILGLLTLELLGALDTGDASFPTGVLLAVLPVPLYLLLALWIDRYEKEPLAMLALAFLWGATGAAFFSLVLNSLSADALARLGGPEAEELGTAVLSAPLVEEWSKGFALFLLFFWKRHEFDNVIDGVLYATMVGLGFAMTENVYYYVEALRRGADAPLTTFVVRGMLAPYAHPFFTAMTGVGLGVARETTRRRVRLLAPVAGLAAAMFVHALWNLSTAGDRIFFGAYALVMVPGFLGMIALVLYAQHRERRIIHAHLGRYRRAGLLDRAELDALCRFGGRSRALWRALRAGGIGGLRREERMHQAASELAFHHWRRRRGISLGPARDAAYEREHLERLRAGIRPRRRSPG